MSLWLLVLFYVTYSASLQTRYRLIWNDMQVLLRQRRTEFVPLPIGARAKKYPRIISPGNELFRRQKPDVSGWFFCPVGKGHWSISKSKDTVDSVL